MHHGVPQGTTPFRCECLTLPPHSVTGAGTLEVCFPESDDSGRSRQGLKGSTKGGVGPVGVSRTLQVTEKLFSESSWTSSLFIPVCCEGRPVRSNSSQLIYVGESD